MTYWPHRAGCGLRLIFFSCNQYDVNVSARLFCHFPVTVNPGTEGDNAGQDVRIICAVERYSEKWSRHSGMDDFERGVQNEVFFFVREWGSASYSPLTAVRIAYLCFSILFLAVYCWLLLEYVIIIEWKFSTFSCKKKKKKNLRTALVQFYLMKYSTN